MHTRLHGRVNGSAYFMIRFPKGLAAQTVHWFLYGRRDNAPPLHYNCRCIVKERPTAPRVPVPQGPPG